MGIEKLAALGFSLIGVVGFCYSIIMIYISSKQKKWIRSKAIVEKSFIQADIDFDEGDRYIINIEYNYNYQGVTYKSSKVTFGRKSFNSELLAKKFLRRYKPSSSSIVYINPKRPKESVLIQGFESNYYVALIFFTLFALFGFLISTKYS